jgi:hypothetical protein
MQMNQVRTKYLKAPVQLVYMLLNFFFQVRGLDGFETEMKVH